MINKQSFFRFIDYDYRVVHSRQRSKKIGYIFRMNFHATCSADIMSCEIMLCEI